MEARPVTLHRARALRRRMSLPEVILWQAVRRNRLGVRFRRQHPEGPWILDLYCHACRLAVEIDGVCHEDPARLARDRRRAVWLESRGISTFRIPAREVLENLDGVLQGLRARIAADVLHQRTARRPLHRRSGGPPPPAGEDF
jgi:very-short-patch-repair endonuclease